MNHNASSSDMTLLSSASHAWPRSTQSGASNPAVKRYSNRSLGKTPFPLRFKGRGAPKKSCVPKVSYTP